MKAVEKEEAKRKRDHLKRYEQLRGKKKPRPMTHIQFHVSIIKSLGFRVPTVDSGPRGRGRPRNTTAAVPGRVVAKRNTATVTVAYGANRSKRKRVAAVARQMPTVRLHGGKRRYELNSGKGLDRFKGGHTIPGLHFLQSVPAVNKFRCQVCRAICSKGHYGPKKKLKNPRWARFTCKNSLCGGIGLCIYVVLNVTISDISILI